MYSFLVIRYAYVVLVKKIQPNDVHHILFRTRFFVFAKFNLRNGSDMDVHRIYYLNSCSLVQVYFKLRTPRCYMCYRPRATSILHCYQTVFGS